MQIHSQSPMEDIIEYFGNNGVDYKQHLDHCLETLRTYQQKLARWSPNDFEAVALDGKLWKIEGNIIVESNENADANTLANDDVLMMANYGRPYLKGKPTGGYYSTPVQGVLPRFGAKSGKASL